jgi:hypothetical protein
MCGGCVGLTTLPPTVSRLSRQCRILNISQPCRPPRPVTGIAIYWISLEMKWHAIIQQATPRLQYQALYCTEL